MRLSALWPGGFAVFFLVAVVGGSLLTVVLQFRDSNLVEVLSDT